MSSFLNRIFFFDVGRIIRAGRSRALEPSDAPPLIPDLDPRLTTREYDTLDTGRFWPFVLRTYFAAGASPRILVFLACLRMGVLVCTLLLLHSVLADMASLPTVVGVPVWTLLTALMLGITGMTGALIQQQFYYHALKTFGTIVNGLNRRIVMHSLHLRRSARTRIPTGDMVNHLSSDTDALAESGFFLPEIWHSLLTLVTVGFMLYFYLGVAAFAAIGMLMLIAPMTILVARRYRKLDHEIMELRDERVTLMSQILHGIRVVKFHAWEGSVHAEVQQVRRREIHTKVRIVTTDAMSTIIFISTTTVVAFAGFGAFVIMGGTLTAPLIFACLALFGMLEEPFGFISHILANIQHARVATGRLDKFFNAATHDIDARPTSAPGHPVGLHATGVTMQYMDAEEPAVMDVSMDIPAGSSIAIIGPVGSGKSTLLRTLLGLHEPRRGSIAATGIPSDQRPRFAYVPQEAFIMNASVRENILFGSAMISDMGPIIHACALEPDVEAMTAGLSTEIGERGVNLSGGQKQRVSLARAVAEHPGIVLLDDPLSAVDVATETILADRLLFGMWKDITRVCVTHRLTHLDRFDRVFYLEKGRIVAEGRHTDLMAGDEAYRRFVETEDDHAATEGSAPTQDISVGTAAHVVIPAVATGIAQEEPQLDTINDGRLTEDEDRETGAVRVDVYWRYVRAMVGHHPVVAPLLITLLVLTAAMITVLPILQTGWLGKWSDNPSLADPLWAVAIYGLIGVAVLLGWLMERLLWLYRSAAAGRIIHDNALAGVLAAPLRFFDSTPMGRILNRFARDMEAVDDHLSWNFEQSFKSLSQTIGSLVLILAVLPVVIVVIVPVLWIYYRLQGDYRRAAREAKRIESIARSPRYAHYKEMVTGLDVIHGFGRERYFIDSFYDILGYYQRMFWCSILLNRWFSVRVPLVSGLVALTTSVGIVVLAWNGSISPGIAGVVLTYALSFWMSLNWTVRAFSEVESRMTSVERLGHYATLPPEPVTTLPEALADDAVWPVRGRVAIRDLSARYAEHLPLVLRDVSFTVEGGAKVGVIGRTGSGKSTLFQTLFRFLEPASGAIEIDGVDIRTVPLPRLRRAIAIIPQDPTLFIGTVRSNLDRFDECTDEDVWNALRRVQLADLVRTLPEGLGAPVAENGVNFSQGQRQLLCMARAILTRARIIVLDEATASVDVQTDAVIQHTVRTEFDDVTVLIIAHRLNTVADADMIVELSHGRVVNITTPGTGERL